MQALENFRARRGGGALRHPPAVHGGHQQILEYREILERPRDLIGASDSGDAALVRPDSGDIATVQADFACIGCKPASDQVEKRRLTCAIRTNNAKRLARCDRQIDIVRSDHRAEALAQAFDFQHALEFSNKTDESKENRKPTPSAHRWPRPAVNRSPPFCRLPEC